MAYTTWSAAHLPSLAERTAVVTGANSGLGFVIAHHLCGAGAHVVLAVRDTDKGGQAAAAIPGSTEVRELDLADLASVRRFADELDPVGGRIDILVNNAGIMHVPHGRTADGFEMHLGVNHLGHFALTNLLLPRITDRVVTMSSLAHRLGTINLEDLNWESRRYDRVRAYGQSKLANLLFTLELQRRLTGAGAGVRALAAHPGYAATNLQTRTGNAVGDLIGRIGNAVIGQNAQNGALPTLFAASQDLPGGSFIGPTMLGMRGGPSLAGRSAEAGDPDLARRLWTDSASLTGTDFPTLD